MPQTIAFKKSIYILLLFLFNVSLFSQSSSVFEASYFSKKETDPPIEAGKGFHINDVYKQTRHCFTPESCDEGKLKSKSGRKTYVTVHYTEDDEQYNLLKTKGVSGKVSYLNLFSLGGTKLESFSSSDYGRQERLVFIAKVDFGTYSYPIEPTLLPEPKALIDQGKHDEFIQMYGTHYISGIRREAGIWVILTKRDDSYSTSTNEENSVDGGFTTPFKVGANYQVNDGTKTEWLKNSKDYELTIEINGPSLEQGSLQKEITELLDSNSPDKVSAIKNLVSAALSNISDPTQSVISQYYFTPFTLYNVSNINWDEQKENNLIRINESVIDVIHAKSVLDKITAPTGIKDIEEDFDGDLSTFSKKDQYKIKIEKTYTIILPTLKSYKKQLDTTINSLQKAYSSCADIHCGPGTGCCSFTDMESKVKMLTYKIDSEIDKITKIKDQAWSEAVTEMLTPECEKEKIGYVTVINKSINPYDFYQGDSFIETLPGGSTKQFKLRLGTHNFKASQQSGFVVYPTVNNRTVTINNYCEEATIKVGFED